MKFSVSIGYTVKDGKSEGEAASINKLNEVEIKLNHMDLKIFYKEFKDKRKSIEVGTDQEEAEAKNCFISNKLIEIPPQASLSHNSQHRFYSTSP